jgi:antitoxin ParD1/3/4
MNVSLTPQLEDFVKEKVKTGRYHSASEVVREALRMLEERDLRLADLRKEIAVGVEQLEHGEYTTYDQDTIGDFFEEIKKEGRKRLKAKSQSKG